MRIRMFLAVALSLCMADFGAFAANVRGGRGTSNNTGATQTTSTATQATSGVVSARAGARQKVANTGVKQNANVSQPAATVSGNVAARAGKKQTQVKGAGGNQVMAARAGATQKVIQTGTKVATATENTTVPQECQDAFNGCVDAFCMLDNANGGRCQCNDKIVELDSVLEDILKLDEQSYLMATEGVERIQMGEGAEAVMARAKSVADETVNAENSEKNKKKARTLDLSAWDNNIFNDADDLFASSDSDVNSFADKKGNALYKASAKLCADQISNKCKEYGSMLQLVYAQKIKSDCVAYENSLKAQKNQSQQKLMTAQKALRDAALEEFQNQNKYATTGECVIVFTQCMKTTAECGDDFTGCVTLAAKENVKGNSNGKKAKQTTIKGAVAGANITLAASTMEQLLSKKTICESVTKQCVNANKDDAVWKAFLHNSAPALKSAEEIAEQNLRSNCIPAAAECFKKACKSQFGDNDADYDICLSNPLVYKSFCKVQLEPCLEATGGTYEHPEKSSLWLGLEATLAAMKVDACTAEVKSCIQGVCGQDYSECIGLDTNDIAELCPYEKLTACMSEQKDKNTVTTYVAQVAQGVALQINNAMLTACQNAVNEAMIKVCGSTDSCSGVLLDKNIGASSLKYQVCKRDDLQQCKDSASLVSESEIQENYTPVISGQVNFGTYITINDPLTKSSSPSSKYFVYSNNADDNVKNIVDSLNDSADRIIHSIENEPKVQYCMTGREVKGFNSANFNKSTQQNNATFPKLTNFVHEIVVNDVYNTAITNYNTKLSEFEAQRDKDITTLSKMTKQNDQSKKEYCEAMNKNTDDWNYKEVVVSRYEATQNACVVTRTITNCKKTRRAGNPDKRACKQWDNPVTKDEKVSFSDGTR